MLRAELIGAAILLPKFRTTWAKDGSTLLMDIMSGKCFSLIREAVIKFIIKMLSALFFILLLLGFKYNKCQLLEDFYSSNFFKG